MVSGVDAEASGAVVEEFSASPYQAKELEEAFLAALSQAGVVQEEEEVLLAGVEMALDA